MQALSGRGIYGNPDIVVGVEDILDEAAQSTFVNALSSDRGLILVAGPMLEPTGSGRAALLYSGMRALAELHGGDYPLGAIEYTPRAWLENATRLIVSKEHGMSFSHGLHLLADQGTKAMLVGEIPDLATAREAVFLTTQRRRHVLSAVSARSAPEALVRLMNLGVAPHDVAEAVTFVIGLRALPKLCAICRKEVRMPWGDSFSGVASLIKLESWMVAWEVNSNGCDHCRGGHLGYHWLCQVMPMSEAIQDCLCNGGSHLELERTAAQEGMATMEYEYLRAVRAGYTALEEFDD